MGDIPERLASAATPDEASEFLELLFARRAFLSVARPLFGVLEADGETIAWHAGGTDFWDLFASPLPDTLGGVLGRLGISDGDAMALKEAMDELHEGESADFPRRLNGRDGRVFSMIFRRRFARDGGVVQFTINDGTRFADAERTVQNLARRILEETRATDEAGWSLARRLDLLEDDFETLASLTDDEAVAEHTSRMTAVLDEAVARSVALLREFENLEEAHTPLEPALLPPPLPAIDDWSRLRERIKALAMGDEALSEKETRDLELSSSFARNAIPLMALGDERGTALALNGARAGRRYETVADLVLGLEVEENSRRTAQEFFEGLAGERGKPGCAVFAMGDRNIEAWGQTLNCGGWQALLVPAVTETVDVRGLFHGFKNLLLHLQVLHVVKTVKDVDEVRPGLADTFDWIFTRLGTLRNIAEGEMPVIAREPETVAQWLVQAPGVGQEFGGGVDISIDRALDDLPFPSIPGEMEDALAELVRNAFQSGASKVDIRARVHHGDHLEIAISDDGKGMSGEKLAQVRYTLAAHVYDPTLSTRDEGTGNGLLGAAAAVERHVDGRILVDNNPEGRGTRVTVAMKIPARG